MFNYNVKFEPYLITDLGYYSHKDLKLGLFEGKIEKSGHMPRFLIERPNKSLISRFTEELMIADEHDFGLPYYLYCENRRKVVSFDWLISKYIGLFKNREAFIRDLINEHSPSFDWRAFEESHIYIGADFLEVKETQWGFGREEIDKGNHYFYL